VALYERGRSAPVVRALPTDPDGPVGFGEVVPRARWVRHDPAHYSVRIEGADGPFTLALAESYGAGWRLSAPPDWSAQHRVLAGYANGWSVDGQGSATVQLRYGSPKPTQVAAVISVATALVVVALSLVTALYRRTHRSAA
jgi:hypothetical protein